MHTPLFSKITSSIQKHSLITAGDTIIVGLSGGPDSVFLLHFLATLKKEYNLTLIAAHLNHGWRESAIDDELFCKTLCTQLRVTYRSAHASELTPTKKARGSLEEEGRILRHHFFAQLAQEYNAHKIALAHHQDDQEETFFIRLIRGASITGLAGMWPQEKMFIRPLLCINKETILSYLHAHNLSYVTDPTNTDVDFLRNALRHKALPALRACDKRFDASLLATMENLQEAEDFLKTITNQKIQTLCKDNQLDIQAFLNEHSYIQKRILVAWLVSAGVPFTPTKAFFSEIIRFFSSTKSNQHAMHETWSCVKNKGKAFITTHKN